MEGILWPVQLNGLREFGNRGWPLFYTILYNLFEGVQICEDFGEYSTDMKDSPRISSEEYTLCVF